MRNRIVTLTLNPTVDIASDAERVRPVHKVRTQNETFDPGGGGVNVSRVLRELGADTLAVVAVGGVSGRLLEELLGEGGLPHVSVPTAGRTASASDARSTLGFIVRVTMRRWSMARAEVVRFSRPTIPPCG